MTLPPASLEPPVRWSLSRKVLFRFRLLDFAIYVLPYPLSRFDSAARLLRLRLEPASPSPGSLRYSEPEPAVLELQGERDGAPTLIRLKQRPLEQFPVVAHRVRWISDLER